MYYFIVLSFAYILLINPLKINGKECIHVTTVLNVFLLTTATSDHFNEKREEKLSHGIKIIKGMYSCQIFFNQKYAVIILYFCILSKKEKNHDENTQKKQITRCRT